MRRSTIVLAALFAVFGLLYWYMQQPGNVIKQALATGTPTASIAMPNLVSTEHGSLNQISIQRADGKSISLKKTGGLWLVATDYEAPANQEICCESLAQQLLFTRMDAKLENAPDLKSLGLDPPAYVVGLTFQDGTITSFKVGAPTVTDSGYYLQAEDKSIGVVAKYSLDMLLALVDAPPFLQTPTPGVTPTP